MNCWFIWACSTTCISFCCTIIGSKPFGTAAAAEAAPGTPASGAANIWSGISCWTCFCTPWKQSEHLLQKHDRHRLRNGMVRPSNILICSSSLSRAARWPLMSSMTPSTRPSTCPSSARRANSKARFASSRALGLLPIGAADDFWTKQMLWTLTFWSVWSRMLHGYAWFHL